MPAVVLSPLMLREIACRASSPDYRRWAAQVRRTGGCVQPIRLRGHVDYRDPLTGDLLHRYSTLHEPGGVLRVACKTRRASRCPACAEIYRSDTYQLIRAGLTGGKGVPDTVTEHPAAFVTLTAPSFGPVHARREKAGVVLPCHARRELAACPHGRPQSCTDRHAADDPRLGEPLCPDCYDYPGSVLFNALAPELWRRFTLALRRRIAKSAGLTVTALRDNLTASFAKVAEYQRRGVVHFHAVIRFDGPDGPISPPPDWADADLLTDAIRHAAQAITVTTPETDQIPARELTWGRQVDVRPITATGELSDQAVAGYIAKYATKAAECVGTLDRRIHPTDDLDQFPIREHARRLITECQRLGALPEFAGLRLTAWAHMLGFRGHFSTKSRRYSTTYTALREARVAFNQREHQITTGRLPLTDQDQVLVLAHWTYAGQGHTHGEAFLSAAINGKPLPPFDSSAVLGRTG